MSQRVVTSYLVSNAVVLVISGWLGHHMGREAPPAFWLMRVVFLLMIPFLPLMQYSKHKRQPLPESQPQPGRERTLSEPPPWPESGEEEVPEADQHLVLH